MSLSDFFLILKVLLTVCAVLAFSFGLMGVYSWSARIERKILGKPPLSFFETIRAGLRSLGWLGWCGATFLSVYALTLFIPMLIAEKRVDWILDAPIYEHMRTHQPQEYESMREHIVDSLAMRINQDGPGRSVKLLWGDQTGISQYTVQRTARVYLFQKYDLGVLDVEDAADKTALLEKVRRLNAHNASYAELNVCKKSLELWNHAWVEKAAMRKERLRIDGALQTALQNALEDREWTKPSAETLSLLVELRSHAIVNKYSYLYGDDEDEGKDKNEPNYCQRYVQTVDALLQLEEQGKTDEALMALWMLFASGAPEGERVLPSQMLSQ